MTGKAAGDPRVRHETAADAGVIAALHRDAFPTPAEAQLVDGLRDNGRLTLSLVAEQDGGVVGHLALSPVTVDGAVIGVGLAPVAVDAAFRRGGVAAALVREALDWSRDNQLGLVVVLGDPDYYGRFGFRPASTLGLVDEYGGGEAFQALPLADGPAPPVGRVQYAPEFAVFSEEA